MYTLAKANDRQKAASTLYRTGSYRLGYHLMPPVGWMNDPHAPLCFGDTIHLFYNLYPFKPHGQFPPKAWAHLITNDLVHFTYLPIAIAPENKMDYHGCASGCAVCHDNALYLVYTAKNRMLLPKETQAVAKSIDGIHFTKCNNASPVLTPHLGDNCRDPMLFKHGDAWHMLLGNQDESRKHGRIAIFTSQDLLHWTDAGIFFQAADGQGTMWECPDYQRVGETDVLFISPIHYQGRRHHTIYAKGMLSPDGLRFHSNEIHTLDDGLDFYSPACFKHPDGRTIMIAWMNTWFRPSPSIAEGWMGALTVPRALSFGEDGLLRMQPIQELESLRRATTYIERCCIDNHNALDSLHARQFELRFHIDWSASKGKLVCLKLFADKAAVDCVQLLFTPEQLVLTDEKHNQHTVLYKRINPNETDVVLYADRFSLELFINNGSTAMTNRVYPSAENDALSFTALAGSCVLTQLLFCPLMDNHVDFDLL